jgi:putative membrane protein insertion efficiency factor
MRAIVLALIRWYQRTLSPDHGPLRHHFPGGVCKFRPTCSEYTTQAVEKYGITRGLLKGGYRIFRCHPWAKGGMDPVK